jgi:hypothetical protein
LKNDGGIWCIEQFDRITLDSVFNFGWLNGQIDSESLNNLKKKMELSLNFYFLLSKYLCYLEIDDYEENEYGSYQIIEIG